MNKNLKDLAVKAARILEDKKGEGVVLYALGDKSSLCDYVIVATATSAPHLNALEEEVSIKLKEDGFFKLNRDGSGSQIWRVSDYGGLILHLMTEEARAYYALDKMFDFAEIIPTVLKAVKKPVKKTTKKITKKTVKKTTKKATKKPAKKTVKKSTKTAKKTVKKAVKKSAKKTTKKGAK
ncbi:MAG: ribosome silencing factor [Elusimicrobiaceae bacterium]|nr:ribosome silencing factor [Elusimicrobiaceae bacterium]